MKSQRITEYKITLNENESDWLRSKIKSIEKSTESSIDKEYCRMFTECLKLPKEK